MLLPLAIPDHPLTITHHLLVANFIVYKHTVRREHVQSQYDTLLARAGLPPAPLGICQPFQLTFAVAWARTLIGNLPYSLSSPTNRVALPYSLWLAHCGHPNQSPFSQCIGAISLLQNIFSLDISQGGRVGNIFLSSPRST